MVFLKLVHTQYQVNHKTQPFWVKVVHLVPNVQTLAGHAIGSIITEDSDRAKQGFVGRKKYPDQYSINFNQICCILSWFEGFGNLSPAFTFVVTAAQNFSTLIKVAWI